MFGLRMFPGSARREGGATGSEKCKHLGNWSTNFFCVIFRIQFLPHRKHVSITPINSLFILRIIQNVNTQCAKYSGLLYVKSRGIYTSHPCFNNLQFRPWVCLLENKIKTYPFQEWTPVLPGGKGKPCVEGTRKIWDRISGKQDILKPS
jgi:hypothetical protein